MNDTRLAVDVTPDEGGGVRLRLSGDIDIAADDALTGAYAEVATAGAPSLVLDFTQVGYINSTGIAVIVRLLAEARRDRREVTAVGLSEHYREIFRITRLSDYMAIADEENGR